MAKPLDALGRISALEEGMNVAGRLMSQFKNNGEATMEIVDAVVAILGHEQVGLQMKKQREERAAAQDAKDAAQLEVLVKAAAEGKAGFVATDRVTENTLIVGHETNKDGNKVPPGRLHMRLFQFEDPTLKAALLGAKVGDEVPTPYEGKVTITALYNEVQAKPAETEAVTTPVPSETKKSKKAKV
jgi:hypothetical protein